MAAMEMMSAFLRVSTLPGRLVLRGLGRRFDTFAGMERVMTGLLEEIEAAQQEARFKIGYTLRKAEQEIDSEPRAQHLDPVQREELAGRLLQLSEQQMLDALGNVYKAVRVLYPRQDHLPPREPID